MKWNILGAGSIGCLWASYLALGGYPVRLLLKDEAAAANFQNSPLSLESSAGSQYPVVDAVCVSELKSEIEWLLVTTKSHVTLDALTAVEPLFSRDCRILLLQNGIGIQQQVVKRYPGLAVIAGVTTDGAYRRGPFQVVHAGRGETLFGAVSDVSTDTVEGLKNCLAGIGLKADWIEDIWSVIWRKVAINCCINPLTAIRRCRNGELLEHQDCLQQIQGLVTEIQQVMSHAGLEFSFPELYQQVLDVIEATADNYSSMYQDVRRGRQSEIENINGFICAQGDELGVPTPFNRALVHQIRSLGEA